MDTRLWAQIANHAYGVMATASASGATAVEKNFTLETAILVMGLDSATIATEVARPSCCLIF